ncbi:MAG TPA: hypothetical protein VK498_10950 [Ferruginibacter sp.]|nr:hypothetical protein [Ferruginibacter sp.]
MALTFEIFYQSVIAVGVIASNIIAIGVYKRNKKIELENSLFKLRLEAIGHIQMEVVTYFHVLDKLKVIINNPEEYGYPKYKEIATDLDNQIYKCQASIIKYSAYFSPEATDKLDVFAEKFLDDFAGSPEEQMANFKEHEAQQIKNATDAVKLLKKESGLDQIHNSLMNRFRKK